MDNLKIFDVSFPQIRPLAEKMLQTAINERATVGELSLAIKRLALMKENIVEETSLFKIKSNAKPDL